MLDLGPEALNERIDALGSGWTGYQSALRQRNATYLRAYSPPFRSEINGGEHDQWFDPFKPEDEGYTRASYNIVRATVDLWTALEAAEFPAIRFAEDFIPTPAPALDEAENARRLEGYRSTKLAQQHIATLREQVFMRHVRKSRLQRHWFNLTRKKNIYGLAWIRSIPDESSQRFINTSEIDPSTVYPVWSAYNDRKLDAILVATRKSARRMAAQYPGSVKLSRDGLYTEESTYYTPTQDRRTDIDRSYVWVEDYWVLDDEWESDEDEDEPIRSRVVRAVRVNGNLVSREEYEGWTQVPYFLLWNNDERGVGFSDVGTVLPFQDGMNRMLSQQQDVIYGESRPRFKYRGDSDREIRLDDESVISLDPDEDIEQLRVDLNVYPTQTHGQQLTQLLQRATGLPAVVWGEIQAAQNSGRALSTAWRATAARLTPRINEASSTLDDLASFWLDLMELYGWDSARDLYKGVRDYEWDFPNQEPRDFLEVTNDAINRMNAGMISLKTAMEMTGEQSPDEEIEAVRSDYMDMVLHPEKGQSYLLLQRLRQQIEAEAAQAGLQQQAILQQLAASSAGAAPGGSVDRAAGQASQARTQAQQQAAPTLTEGQNGPATQAGAAGNSTKFSTLVQDGGSAMNRIVDQGQIGGP